MPAIDKHALGPLARVGDGGFGIVYRAARHQLAGHGPLAYKEFRTTPDARALDNLAEVIDFRENLDPLLRARLDASTTWPLRLVSDRGRVTGYVMRFVPDEFFFEQKLPSGKVSREDREAQWLVVDPARAADASITVPAADDTVDRLVLCIKLAYVFGLLHRQKMVYGDLSLKNVLFAEKPWRVMLVDCDGATARADVEQANTPDWVPPEIGSGGQRAQDELSDRYKLALFILRCLNPGPRASLTVDPDRVADRLDDEGLHKMHAGVGADRARRPSAKEWCTYLTRRLTALTSPPSVALFTVDPDMARIGAGVTVRWDASGATRVVITGADGARTEIPSARGEQVLTLRCTGSFTLTAENGYGRATRTSGSVFALRPPDIRFVRIPEPALPAAEPGVTTGLAEVLRELAVTRTTTPVLALPDANAGITFPEFPDLLGLLLPAGGPAPGADSFAGLMAALQADAEAVVRAAAPSASATTRSRS